MKAIKRIKEIQKIQRFSFTKTAATPPPGLELGIPKFEVRCLIHWATGPFLREMSFKAWNATEESGNSPAGVQES